MDKDKYAPQKKYHSEHYGRPPVSIRKEILTEFAEKCKSNGVSQASVLSEFMQEYCKEEG